MTHLLHISAKFKACNCPLRRIDCLCLFLRLRTFGRPQEGFFQLQPSDFMAEAMYTGREAENLQPSAPHPHAPCDLVRVPTLGNFSISPGSGSPVFLSFFFFFFPWAILRFQGYDMDLGSQGDLGSLGSLFSLWPWLPSFRFMKLGFHPSKRARAISTSRPPSTCWISVLDLATRGGPP